MSVAPPRPKGPPLNALRAFEAAARLGGFALAAEELCVTPGAISQHVRVLENWAGVELFERRSRGVTLTKTGHDSLEAFSLAFDQLSDAVRNLQSMSASKTIEIATLPSLAQLWLATQLSEIRPALLPQTVSVSAFEQPPNMTREIFDISIFFRPLSGLSTEIDLGRDVITPVCAPKLAKRLTQVADLKGETLLFDSTLAHDWDIWAAGIAPEHPPIATGARFSLYSLALEEAKNGAGVLMGHSHLVANALAKGELVSPFGQWIATGRHLVLECGRGSRRSAAVRKLVRALAANTEKAAHPQMQGTCS